MYKFVVESPFNFGDHVEVKSTQISGRGKVLDIAFGEDRKVYYVIIMDDGDGYGGIDPSEMRLVEPNSNL